MRVSYNWLKQYVDIDISPTELADKLTMAGLEVDQVEYLAEGIDKVVVGRLVQISPHPNGDKLVVCMVDAGDHGNELQIITGATNVAEGQLVPVALVGAQLPGNFKIRKANLRGVPSYGMLCSAEELKLNPSLISPEDREGIMILGSDAIPGSPITEYLGLEDYVLEIELTPNRSDCLSMINIAREVAAITGASLKLPSCSNENNNALLSSSVTIEATDLCYRYIALMLEDIHLGPSPRWMQQRLMAGGMRPINTVVDVTNYVMLETGQPLHAFDFDTLQGGKIIVRRAIGEERITTLDGVERQLDEDMLVIADDEEPVAIAGVMGGLDTEVTEATTKVLLESAHFDSASIRKTGRRLGLRSEASNRFEKGVNRDKALFAALRAVELIEELSAGRRVPGKIDVYPVPWEPAQVTLRTDRTNDILGTDFSQDKIKSLLAKLDLEIHGEKEGEITYLIPSYRQDITKEIDLIEEVARLYGYNRIPVTLPKSQMSPEEKTPLQTLETKIKDLAIGLGLTEVVTYSFISPKSFDKLNLPEEHPWRQVVTMANPLTEDQSVMRTTLLPGLLDTADRNFNRRQQNLSIFEIGRIFNQDTDQPLPIERTFMGLLISGSFNPGWAWPKGEFEFFYLKGVIETLLQRSLGHKTSLNLLKDHPAFHPGRAGQILCQGETIGVFGELHPDVQENYGFNQRIYISQLDLDALVGLGRKEMRVQPIPKFPDTARDMAVLLPENTPSEGVGRLIEAVGGELVGEYQLFDVYRGPQIPAGYKSLAYGITYQAAERTLTDGEINQLHEKIKEEIKIQLGAEFR